MHDAFLNSRYDLLRDFDDKVFMKSHTLELVEWEA
jgi:hypothetical protein